MIFTYLSAHVDPNSSSRIVVNLLQGLVSLVRVLFLKAR